MALSHLKAIVSLDGVPLRLINTVLQTCDAATLSRLERESNVSQTATILINE